MLRFKIGDTVRVAGRYKRQIKRRATEITKDAYEIYPPIFLGGNMMRYWHVDELAPWVTRHKGNNLDGIDRWLMEPNQGS